MASDIEAFLDGVRKQLRVERENAKEFLAQGRCSTFVDYQKRVAQIEMTIMFEDFLKMELRKWES